MHFTEMPYASTWNRAPRDLYSDKESNQPHPVIRSAFHAIYEEILRNKADVRKTKHLNATGEHVLLDQTSSKSDRALVYSLTKGTIIVYS